MFKIITFLLISSFVFSQENIYNLYCNGKLMKSFKDSITTKNYLDGIAKTKYLSLKITKTSKVQNQINIEIDKGINFSLAKIDFPSEELKNKYNPNGLILNIDSTKQKIHADLLNQGFLFNRIGVEIKDAKPNDTILRANLKIYTGEIRKIDSLVFVGYNNMPKAFKKQLEKQSLGKIYSEKNIKVITNLIQSNPFIGNEKDPQNLFKNDKSSLFIYLKKKKNNSFDGVLGFGNDRSDKIKLTGNIQVFLINSLNFFEKINLNWQRTPDEATNFEFSTEVPYILNSQLGAKLFMNIYRQDSTFANVKIQPALFYQLDFYQKIGFKANLENATVIAKTTLFGQDYSKTGLGIFYDYQKASSQELMIFKRKIFAEIDYLNSLYSNSDQSLKQINYKLKAEENLPIKNAHYININLEINHIQSENTLGQNEQLRFGGWNSFRGVNELSLFAKTYAFGGLEYRYLANETAFFDVFSQYANLVGVQNQQTSELINVGLGFLLKLNFGILSFQVSNAKLLKDPFQFDQTKIHFGIISKF